MPETMHHFVTRNGWKAVRCFNGIGPLKLYHAFYLDPESLDFPELEAYELCDACDMQMVRDSTPKPFIPIGKQP